MAPHPTTTAAAQHVSGLDAGLWLDEMQLQSGKGIFFFHLGNYGNNLHSGA